MKSSRLSMLSYGGYLAIMGSVFLFHPNPLITWLGFSPSKDVWIHILGMILLILSGYFFAAVREQVENFYRWTGYARLPVLFIFSVFVLQGMAPPILLLFGLVDSMAALWTLFALHRERMTG